MEKLPGGKCVFRSPRCEERISKKFENDVQRKRDKIMSQVEKEVKDEAKSSSGKTDDIRCNTLMDFV